ncbi:MAG: hypothetical protein PARBA_01878 [Parabacteroides sp.]
MSMPTTASTDKGIYLPQKKYESMTGVKDKLIGFLQNNGCTVNITTKRRVQF